MTNYSGKWFNLTILSLSSLMSMTLWFSASAVVPQLTIEWSLGESAQAWMTMSVQLGFVVGALVSALLNLADRFSSRTLIAISSTLGGLFTAAIALISMNVETVLLMRFLTGVCLAGVYPPGMKLVAGWCREDRGFGIGILVGALAVGSATPHLINGLALYGDTAFPEWRVVFLVTAASSVLSAIMIAFFFRAGPYHSDSAPFNWRFAAESFRHAPTRLANFGYLGHMWELYAMWTWVPVLLMVSYEASSLSPQAARFAGFGVIAIGSVSSVMAGRLADRFGRTSITIWSLVISGLCCLTAGLFFSYPILLTILCLIWGFAVVADSAQFSAAISELTDPRYIGTALTIQTSIGFLLTMLTIRLVPTLVNQFGWEWVFTILALGPMFGIWSMKRLRSYPEAKKMASGKR